MVRKLAGYALIYGCGALDLVPSYEEGRWYLHGLWGCRFGVAALGFRILDKEET